MGTNLRADIRAEADEALARSAVYRLLSQVLVYPSASGVEQLQEEDLPLAAACAGPLPEEVRTALGETEAAFLGLDVERLEGAFRDVFSHVHSADCPAYETDYTAREIWRQSQELADLAGFYRAFGMEGVAERPDHVAVELEFLHLVSYKAAWALIQDDPEHARICASAERDFLADHVLKWIPGFATRVVALAGDGPYRAAARLAEVFLRSEARRFGIAEEKAGPTLVRPQEAEVDEVGLCEGEP